VVEPRPARRCSTWPASRPTTWATHPDPPRRDADAAKDLRFEEAAGLRDEINELRRELRPSAEHRTSVRFGREAGKPGGWRSRPGARTSGCRAPASTTCKNVDLCLLGSAIVFTACRVGQVVAGVRHHLRRGQTPLRRVALGLRRQFLGQMDKPDVDFIEGLSRPSRSTRNSASRNPRRRRDHHRGLRYLRLLYARIGVPHCRTAGGSSPARRPSRSWNRVLELPDGTRLSRCSPRCAGPQRRVRRVSKSSPPTGSPEPGPRELHELGDRVPARLARTSSTPSRSSSIASCAGPGSSGASPDFARDRAAPRRRRRRGGDRPRDGDDDAEAETLNVLRASCVQHCGLRSTSWPRATSRSLALRGV